jgi:FHS family L-fucose permease-like MFS transporter
MAFDTGTLTRSTDDSADETARYTGHLQAFVFALFFAFGGITSLNDVLIPKLKALFTLSYAEVMLVQSAFFAAYFIVSIPAAALVRRIGYMRSASVGLLTAGCPLFSRHRRSNFTLFLVALFVLAAGITTVQVVANPLISMLGRAATASSRLTLRGIQSLGTTIFRVGSMILARWQRWIRRSFGEALDAFRGVETRVIVHTYLGSLLPRWCQAVGCAGRHCQSRARNAHPARVQPVDPAALRLRHAVHISVRRRRSRHRVADRELPDAEFRARRGGRGGR